MGVETIFPREPIESSWATRAASHYVRVRGRVLNSGLVPVINCHADPQSGDWIASLTQASNGSLFSLFRAGYAMYSPFTGRNWGHESNIFPTGTGGTGTQAIDDIITALGNPPKVALTGVSMGGLNVLRWGMDHPSQVHSIRAFTPAWDLLWLYDTNPGYQASLNGVYGTANRAAFVSASAAYDPRRNAGAIAAIPAPVSVFAASDDAVVGFSGMEAWAAAAGIELTVGTGGHLAWPLSAPYDELDLLRTIQAGY